MRMNTILKFINNKVITYIFSRYLICGISFFTSLLLAVNLSPYYLGVWGAFLLIRRYFQLINFGIPDSSSILVVQNFDNRENVARIEINSLFVTFVISLISVVIFLILFLVKFDYIIKYDLYSKWFVICAIVVLTYIDDLLFKIFRAKGKVSQLTFYQSIIQLLLFICVFFAKDSVLVWCSILAYLVGLFLSLTVFLKDQSIRFNILYLSTDFIGKLLSKGCVLFIYNISFYFILLSTRTFVSAYYSIEEFGLFTFAYTLSNAIIVLLDALSSLITPKLIDKFVTSNITSQIETLLIVKNNYIFLSFLLCFCIIAFLPILLLIFPLYSETFPTVCYLSIASSIFSCSFGLSTYMVAKNKEKQLALVAVAALIVNVILCFFLTSILNCGYEYLCISTIISYFIYTVSCFKFFKINSFANIKFNQICLSYKTIIPLIFAIIVSLCKLEFISFIPLLIYILLNLDSLKEVFDLFLKVLNKPNIVNINH